MQIINRLKNPELSENLLQQVENTLRQQLEEAFDAVNREIEHRAADSKSLARTSTERDREAIRATDQAGDRENVFSRAISAKTSRFSADPINEAVEVLDQRRELQQEQERKRDRGNDFSF